MFRRILGTVVDALARRKPTTPVPLPSPRQGSQRQTGQHRDANARGKSTARAEDAAASAARAIAESLPSDPVKLLPLLDQPATRGAALTRLAELAAGGSHDDSLGAALTHRPELAIEMLLASHDPSYAGRTLQTITDGATLLRVATGALLPRVRQLAAARVNNEADLAELERKSRGHDKLVHRLAKSRLEEQRKANTALSAHTAALNQLRERVVQLERSEHDPLFNARLDHLQRSFATWQTQTEQLRGASTDDAPTAWTATDIAASLAASAERASANAHLRHAASDAAEPQPVVHVATTAAAAEIDAVTPPRAPPAPPVAELTAAARAAIAAEHEAALEDLSAVHADVCRDPSQVADRLALVPPALELVQRRWSTASDRAAPSAAVAENFHAVSQHLKAAVAAAQRYEQAAADVASLAEAAERAAKSELPTPSEPDAFRRLASQQQERHSWSRRARELRRRIDWPPTHAADPAQLSAVPEPLPIAQLQAGIAAADAFDSHCNQQWQNVQTQLATALDTLDGAIAAGSYRGANMHLNDARRWLRCLPNRFSAKAQARCTALAARVQEMRDWQDFATHPKREALCASMQSLAEEQLAHESRLDRIKALRADWHDLGPLTSAGERALFEKFNAAAELAYSPSRAYFEEQARIRTENLGHRQRVCQTLADYVANNDWTKADWRLAQQVLRLAREEFLTYSPVDHGPGRDVGKRFDAAADALHALIKGEWDSNVALKEKIVADAAQLLAATEPPSIRIERVKSLQHAWRGVGATPRGADQRLWKSFRTHCDAVFALRDEERQNYERAAQTEAENAEGVCEALEARVTDPTPITNQTELHNLRTRFEAIQLNGEHARRLQRRFKDGEQTYLQRLREQQHAARRQDFLAALRAHDVVAGFECNPDALDETALTNALALAPDADLEARAAALRAGIDGNAAAALPTTPDDQTYDARLRWTIYAEILAGLESPGEDQSLRLELQVNRLAEGLGRRGGERLDLPGVINAWVSAGADRGDAQTSALRQRLDRAIDAYLG